MRVSVDLGCTVPFPGDRFGNVKPGLSIIDLDPDGDVDAQIESALNAMTKMWVALDGKLAAEIPVLIAEAMTPPSEIAALKKQLAINTENNRRIADELKEQKALLVEKVKARGKEKAAD